MSDIVERLTDLLAQATVERSHHYVGKCCTDAIQEIEQLRAALRASQAENARLRDELSIVATLPVADSAEEFTLGWLKARARAALAQGPDSQLRTPPDENPDSAGASKGAYPETGHAAGRVSPHPSSPSDPRLTTAPGGEAVAWRCAECGCLTFARCDDMQADGSYAPGPCVRCVSCKNVTYFPRRHPEAGEREGVIDLTALQAIARSAMHEAGTVSEMLVQGKRIPRGMTENLRNYINQFDRAIRALASPTGEKEPGK